MKEGDWEARYFGGQQMYGWRELRGPRHRDQKSVHKGDEPTRAQAKAPYCPNAFRGWGYCQVPWLCWSLRGAAEMIGR